MRFRFLLYGIVPISNSPSLFETLWRRPIHFDSSFSKPIFFFGLRKVSKYPCYLNAIFEHKPCHLLVVHFYCRNRVFNHSKRGCDRNNCQSHTNFLESKSACPNSCLLLSLHHNVRRLAIPDLANLLFFCQKTCAKTNTTSVFRLLLTF